MSTDNKVIPIRTAGDQPPQKPTRKRHEALDEDTEGEATPWLVSAARVLASLLHHAAEYESDEV
jgi:hypothetical protein